MKITREEKKAEAIRRMKMLEIFPETIRQFEKENLISVSEPPFGAFYWADEEQQEVVAEQPKQEDKTEELKAQPISILDLTTRASNSLKNAEIETIGQLISYSEVDLMEFDKFGKTSLKEIKEKLSAIGLSLKEQL